LPIEHRLLDNRRILRAIEDEAMDLLEAGNVEMALRVVSSGSEWSWLNHPGVYASPTFEKVAIQCGRIVLEDLTWGTGSDHTKTQVLHVLTQAYEIGGHTRFAWHWMRRDASSVHSAVLTSQGDLPVPEELVAAASGGLYRLAPGTNISRCRDLASIVGKHDLVVLHLHPHDAVAVAACGGLVARPRTLYVNHADHVFWLGVGVTDGLIHIRPSGLSISRGRRGIDESRCFGLPIPLEERSTGEGRAFRAARGIDMSDTVMLTIAQPYKYANGRGVSFPELARDVLRKVPRSHLVAVGPDPSSTGWTEIGDEFGQRVHLLGVTKALDPVIDAADIYLDSFPCASLTSALEAALAGVPVLCFSERAFSPLQFDDLTLTPAVARSPQAWTERVLQWSEDREARRAEGARMRAEVMDGHVGEAWVRRLADVYAALQPGVASCPVAVHGDVQQYDCETFAVHAEGDLTGEADWILPNHGLVLSEPHEFS
jgi:hypothetical protein